MWSFFRKIFQNFSSADSGLEETSLFPKDIDKLREEFSGQEELDGPGGPITAREAFELADQLVSTFDPNARLTRLESRGQLADNGRCEGWEFHFILPDRWGQARFVFSCGGGEESVEVLLKPFAAIGSALDRMLGEGQDGFVEQQWKVEMERQSSLSHSFQDSSQVLEAWAGAGKPVDFSSRPVLRAVTPPLGKARWELLESSNSKKSLYTLPIE